MKQIAAESGSHALYGLYQCLNVRQHFMILGVLDIVILVCFTENNVSITRRCLSDMGMENKLRTKDGRISRRIYSRVCSYIHS